jgi:glycosyltransferase involved in cell wall biosynthesis
MSIWRDDGPVRRLARKLPRWAKRLARRILGVADRISRRFSTPKAAGIPFPTAGITPRRETVLLIVHEATRTGAPILAWNLVGDLRETYNVVVLLRRGGPLRAGFEGIASAVICLPDDFPMQPREIEVLARQIYDNYAPKYAIANSVESRFVVAELEALSIPVVALVHEFSSAYRPVGILHGLFKVASAIVFSAQIVADSAAADYKILQARDFKILPQGPSKLPFLAASDRREPRPSRNSLPGNPEREFRVIGIGTITMRKGVDLFIAAAAAVKEMLPDRKVRFAWVGAHYSFDQPYFDALKQQLDESGLNGDVELLGELDDLDPVYDRADAFFLSSRLDPLPNVAIDSALRGLPIVCFDQTSGIAELLLKHDETRALVVPHLDSRAAARLICSLATDAAKLDRFSAAIAGIARQHFNMENYVKQIDELGTRARRSLVQIKEDQKTILQHGAFNRDLHFGYDSDLWSADAGVWKYLADSRLAAPWNKPLAGTFMRRPLEGFNPLIYASENPGFDPQRQQDPLAHFAGNGRPSGRWTHRVITPTVVNDDAPAGPLKIAVHGHFHYPELLPDFIRRLNLNKNSFDLFLTTTTQAKADEIAHAVANFELKNVEIAVGSNRGRDLAPFLKGLGDGLYSAYDVVGHFHGKRSPHVENTTGDNWRTFLSEHLVGGEFAMADAILRVFAEEPRVGLVFAEDPHLNGWDENFEIAEALVTRMKLPRPLPMHFDFPIGTMFWARPEALKPLLRLNLHDDDFPAEPLPIDGTMLHTLERIIPFAAAEAGFEYATTYVRQSKR